MPDDNAPETLLPNLFQRVKQPSLPQWYSTRFVGRERELAEIQQRLSDPACRLLTLVGSGGVGKTRLAVEAAALFSEGGFRDGTYFVALQPLTSADLIVSALAEALQFQFAGSDDPQNQLLSFLREMNALLALDNFEHLLDGIGLLSEILVRAPSVKVLVTSRERLNLRDEWVFDVRGLNYPAGERSGNLEEYSAVQLFVNSARRIKADFSMASELAAAARICALLEGMPLAIELASSWVRALSCRDILTEMQRGLDILETSARDVPARHRSMGAVLDTSWKRLTEIEQAVIMKVSVFRGGFTLDAAQTVTGATPHLLSALIDQSWLRLDFASERYEVHELLRQYGEEKLSKSGSVDETRHTHCHYYADFMSEREAHLKDQRQIAALNEIEADLENIRTAWDWAGSEHKEIEMNGMVYSLWFFYDTRARWHEGNQLFAKAAATLRSDAQKSDDNLLLGRTLASQGALYGNLELLEEALAIFRRIDAHEDIAFCLVQMGKKLLRIKDHNLEAQTCYQTGLDLYRDLDDPFWIAEALNGLAVIHSSQGNLEGARQALVESLTLSKQVGNLFGTANATHDLGVLVMRRIGDYDEALRLIQEAYSLHQQLGVQWGMGGASYEMVRVCLETGDYDGARRSLLNALTLWTRLSMVLDPLLWTLSLYINLLQAQGEVERAVEIFALIEKECAGLGGEDPFWLLELRDTFQAKLPAPRFLGAHRRGQSLDLEATVKRIMIELSRPIQPPQALFDPLTVRELEVLHLIAAGLTNREISEHFVITPGTAKWYVSKIFSKLAVNNRTQAVARARKLQLIP